MKFVLVLVALCAAVIPSVASADSLSDRQDLTAITNAMQQELSLPSTNMTTGAQFQQRAFAERAFVADIAQIGPASRYYNLAQIVVAEWSEWAAADDATAAAFTTGASTLGHDHDVHFANATSLNAQVIAEEQRLGLI